MMKPETHEPPISLICDAQDCLHDAEDMAELICMASRQNDAESKALSAAANSIIKAVAAAHRLLSEAKAGLIRVAGDLSGDLEAVELNTAQA